MLLLIDNFDSFTHNLARYFTELGINVEVVRNNAVTIADIEGLSPSHLVISPGPCTPNESGISLQAIRHFQSSLPILGVCLGHQAIGQVFGATVVGAKEIKHGKVSELHHTNKGLFSGLPTRFNVTRYHSLVIEPSTLPACLNVDAWCMTDDNQKEIMALSHKSLPIWGVQYHPESLLTEYGHDVLKAFLTA
ncbi:aminodeoxychorismate/anthranilate synthase component II [Alteromonas sp. 345S023]|uniref:Aminodeoxychorismate/anthranilate synthase component II n=1 Tax=Alteromonas profundi TaxID=2696062 RepID=A0A7X5RLI5_9ALTE|nr:aminodeoxychorismate/anthranilate synthase component II [Alteromonas profundi]